jgi:hypothetical protein
MGPPGFNELFILIVMIVIAVIVANLLEKQTGRLMEIERQRQQQMIKQM